MEIPIGQKIKIFRKSSKLTQKELAEKIGVHRTSLSSWESGRTKPPEKKIKDMAKIFQINANDLRQSLPQGISNIIDMFKRACLNQGLNVISKIASYQIYANLTSPKKIEQFIKTNISSENIKQLQHELDNKANEQFIDFFKSILPQIKSYGEKGIIIFSEENTDEKGRIKPITLYINGEIEDDLVDFNCNYFVILDPLDRSTEAIRSIAGFANLTLCSFNEGPLFSIVYHSLSSHILCYYAVQGKDSFVKLKGKEDIPIKPATTKNLSGSCLASYIGKPIRMERTSRCKQLFKRQKEESVFVNVSGSYGFALCASGQIDGYFEVSKGYRFHDIISGAHILLQSGGVVRNLEFSELENPFNMELFKITEERLNNIDKNVPEEVLQYLKTNNNQYKTYHHIVNICTQLVGNNIENEYRTNILKNLFDLELLKDKIMKRQRFIAACSLELCGKICFEIGKENLSFHEWD